MTTWDRVAVADRLFAHWHRWRAEGRFDGVLPGCSDQEWSREGAIVGYRTVDYRLSRDLVVPGGDAGADAVADLVEVYWSVRTRGGAQDPDWPPSLNVDVVTLGAGPLHVGDVERMYRLTLALRTSLMLAGMSRLSGRRGGVSLYVRGVLLGPESDDSAVLADALSAFSDVPIAVAQLTLDADGAPEVRRSPGAARFFDPAAVSTEALRDAGRALIGGDRLLKSEGIWTAKPEA